MMLFGDGIQRFRVGDGHFGPAAHADGLEMLRAHHRAHAGAPGGAPVIVHHCRHHGLVFARLPDAGDARPAFAHHRADLRLRCVAIQSPQIGRVVQRGFCR